MLAVVQTEFRYRGRNISGAEIESVRQLIADHPGLSRRRLSAKLCQAWNWVQANPFDYLMALQQHAAAVPKTPDRWLPWNYEQAIAAAGCG